MIPKRTTFKVDQGTDEVVIERVEDVENIIETNKALYNMTDERARYSGDSALGTHVASIPPIIYFQLQAAGILDDEERFKAWLNDPANRFMRTRPGKV